MRFRGLMFGCLLCRSSFGNPADATAAVAAFDEAERLATEGNYAEACPKYEESHRIDPQLGVLLRLADCDERVGLRASAWVRFRDAADLAARKGDPREQIARRRAADLEARVPRLRIIVPQTVPEGMRVERDGTRVGTAQWGLRVPVDPGEHTVIVAASGYRTWKTVLVVSAETTGNLDVTVPPLTADNPAPLLSPQDHSEGTTQRIVGFGALGLGVVGASLGIGFAVKTAHKLDERDAVTRTCVDLECDPSQKAAHDEAQDAAHRAHTTSVVGFVAGGVFAATGVVLLLTAPHRSVGSVALVPSLSLESAGMVGRIDW